MALYHVVVTCRDAAGLADLVRVHRLIVARHTVVRRSKGTFGVHAHADAGQIRGLITAGYRVKRLENADRLGRTRQAEYQRALTTRQRASRGLTAELAEAAKGLEQYLSVDEVEAAVIELTSGSNAGFTELITLPNQTWEGRVCHAMRIGKKPPRGCPGIYFLGGVHAREWGSPDILINFVRQVTSAYRSGSGLTFGPKKFTGKIIRSIIEQKNLFVFPQANPDGRTWSMTKEAMWRKNRRPGPLAHADCIGVDINRNYDFLWDYPKYFDPKSPIANSIDPCDPEVFIGPSRFSEPETQNAAWLFDTYPDIRYFIDLHSFSESILYSWGDDDDQTADSKMNFLNPAYDGKRGMVNDKVYREYLEATDKSRILKLARQLQTGIAALRGKEYKIEQSVGLYPTAGTSDDYAFSRHLVDSSKTKVLAYTIEWGSPKNKTPFHPPYPEMKKIIEEVTGGLVAFCASAT